MKSLDMKEIFRKEMGCYDHRNNIYYCWEYNSYYCPMICRYAISRLSEELRKERTIK